MVITKNILHTLSKSGAIGDLNIQAGTRVDFENRQADAVVDDGINAALAEAGYLCRACRVVSDLRPIRIDNAVEIAAGARNA